MNAKLVTKSVEATVEPVPDAEAEHPDGEFKVLLATPGTDRDGDDLQAKGWQLPLPDHITFDTDHRMSVQSLVGSGPPTLERDGSITVKGIYADTDHAQNTRKLVNKRHIRTVSVTYLQRTTKAAGGKTSVVRELLNGSFVAVPANPKAVVLSSKGLGAAVVDDELDNSIEVRFNDADIAAIAEATAKSLSALTYSAAGGEGTYSMGRSAVTIVTKGLAGSVEELGDRMRKAVREAHRGDRTYPYVRATFLNDAGSGTVVYDLESYSDMSSSSKTLARDFSLEGSKVTLDDPREVSLVTSVVDDDKPDEETTAKGIGNPLDRAIEMLVSGGMTHDAATKALEIVPTGDNLASSEHAAAVPTAAGAAVTKAAAPAAKGDTAASLDARATALLSHLDDAAG